MKHLNHLLPLSLVPTRVNKRVSRRFCVRSSCAVFQKTSGNWLVPFLLSQNFQSPWNKTGMRDPIVRIFLSSGNCLSLIFWLTAPCVGTRKLAQQDWKIFNHLTQIWLDTASWLLFYVFLPWDLLGHAQMKRFHVYIFHLEERRWLIDYC